MLFMEELIEEIINLNKTQTRRPVKQDEKFCLENGLKTVFTPGLRIKWQVGRDYAVQAGRGMPTVFYQPDTGKLLKKAQHKELIACNYPTHQLFEQGYQHLRITLTNIRVEDVRNISRADGLSEGFIDHKIGFWKVWSDFYDQKANVKTIDPAEIRNALKNRPDNLYLSWALTFKIKEIT